MTSQMGYSREAHVNVTGRPKVSCALELRAGRDTQTWAPRGEETGSPPGPGMEVGVWEVCSEGRPGDQRGQRCTPGVPQIQPLPVAQPGAGGSPVELSGTGGGREVTKPSFYPPSAPPRRGGAGEGLLVPSPVAELPHRRLSGARPCAPASCACPGHRARAAAR